MSLVNVKQINTTTINADTGGYKDCFITMSAISGGTCEETRVISQSLTLPAQSGGDITETNLTLGIAATYACEAKGKLKLVIPLYLNIDFNNEANLALLASEIFNNSINFGTEASGMITRFAGLRKNNPSIVFNLYSLQYLNAGRILINKNKYL